MPAATLADRDDLDDIVEAIARGVCGFITTSMAKCKASRAAAPSCRPIPWIEGRPGDAQKGLTPRESEVLSRLTEGKSNKVIDRELDIRKGTVKVFVRRILGKLHTSNRTELALLARAQSAGESRPPGRSGSP